VFWIVSYDIPSDKRRRRVGQILEGYGRRAQYSVFECEITEEQRERLEKALQQVIDEHEDDIRFYPMNRADIGRVRLLGRAELYRARGWYLV